MSRFAKSELKNIVFGNGDIVKIPVSLSYGSVLDFNEKTKGKSDMEISVEMLLFCIREWSFADDDGVVPEINRENLLRLDLETITEITNECAKLFSNNQDKKK